MREAMKTSRCGSVLGTVHAMAGPAKGSMFHRLQSGLRNEVLHIS